jgi:hypothetical protein
MAVDSTYVFAPGERLTDDSTGAPIIGATIEFYDAGTTTPKTVYATADLDQGDNPAPLGTSVVTDSLGYPTSDGSSRTLIYVGTQNYKLVVKDADGNTIVTHDNIPGAVVSASSLDVSVTSTFPVATKSLDYTVTSDDQNTTFVVNCSSGDVALTLPSATDDDIPNGWKIKVQHAGSGNQAIVKVKSGSGQNIYEGTKTHGGGSFALALNGEDCEITADGGNWRVTGHTAPFIKLAQGIIPVTDRVSTSPGSPQAGAIYLLTGVGGDFSTFNIGDIAQYTGAGWVNWTPYTDCGWIAFVQDENLYYEYQDSAWVAQTATATFAGRIKLATQAVMETGTANDSAVTPGTQIFHPSACKAWGKASGGASIQGSYNVSSATNGGTGKITFSIATDFSSGNWGASASMDVSGGVDDIYITGQSSSALTINSRENDGTFLNPDSYHFTGFGDQ